MSQIGYCKEVKGLIVRHGGDKRSGVPVENYAEFIAEVLKFYKEKKLKVNLQHKARKKFFCFIILKKVQLIYVIGCTNCSLFITMIISFK
ncbi:MAG: hypothetical protein LBS41_01070 [Streptococcaceae bacterium]|nr:hypothetical protein [Streptococcaceae bacterium]